MVNQQVEIKVEPPVAKVLEKIKVEKPASSSSDSNLLSKSQGGLKVLAFEVH